MALSQDLTGQQFGSYRIVRRLGVGGFASVYLGQHVRISSMQAAVKILDLRDVNEQQFQQEAETTARLVHPNIVRLLDFDIQQGTPFLVLEYASGGTLSARHPKGSQVPLAAVIGYLKELAPALQHAHDQHILHRDIKPDNILIGRQGELLLSDFGIALLSRTGRTTSMQAPTNTGGTPYYMAPEQFRGRPEKASDQYALAVVTYEWLCGTIPFSEGDWIQLGFQQIHEPVPPLRASVPTLPIRVEQVILKALAKAPEDRFPTITHFVEALSTAQQEDAVPTQSISRPNISRSFTIPIIPASSQDTQPPQIVPSGVHFLPISESHFPLPLPPSPSSADTPDAEPIKALQSSRLAPDLQKQPFAGRLRRTLIGLLCFVLLLGGGGTTWFVVTQQQANVTPHTNATATRASQQTAQTPGSTTTNQTEQNPYGNHNGILVLNDPL